MTSGGPAPNPWCLPVTTGETGETGGAGDVATLIGELAELWVIARHDGARAGLIERASAVIAQRRSAAGLGSARVGQSYGRSLTEALLLAARSLTAICRQHFGCRALLDIVEQQVEPQQEDVVWVIGQDAVAYLTFSPEGADALLRPQQKRRTAAGHLDAELTRRLLYCETAAAVRAIQVPQLCDWLRQVFGDVDWPRLQAEVDLEFIATGTGPSWNGDTRTLSLDGIGIKSFASHPATNQLDVIEAFERAAWAEAIDSPFGADQNKLRQTVTDLNRGLPANSLKFRMNGAGDGVRWERH
jgi:hypothetical protein